VDDVQIADMNKTFLHRTGPTDVISFSQLEGAYTPRNNRLLGDVVISLETAQRQAQAAGTTLQGEVVFLLVHGMLHLLGYDHEGSGKKAREMRAREKELICSLKNRITC